MKKLIPVVVTTEKRGVFFGYIPSIPKTKPSSLTLKNARNCIYWSSETKGFMGLMATGPLTGSKVGPAADEFIVYGITSVGKCSQEAAERWEEGPWK